MDDWRAHALCARAVDSAAVVQIDEDGTVDVVEPWWWEVGKGRLTRQNQAAIRICRRCPVRAQCRANDDELDSAVIRDAQTPTEREKTRHSRAA